MGANTRSVAPLAYHNDCQAACFAFASRCARALFPSLAATAMLSKKTGEDLSAPTDQHGKFPISMLSVGDREVSRVKSFFSHAPINSDGRLIFKLPLMRSVRVVVAAAGDWNVCFAQ